MKPVDVCDGHDYVWVKEETIVSTEPSTCIIPRSIYACVHCGLGMDVYELDRKIDVITQDNRSADIGNGQRIVVD